MFQIGSVVRCGSCNSELRSTGNFKIDRKTVGNTQINTYTCHSCLRREMHRVSPIHKYRSTEELGELMSIHNDKLRELEHIVKNSREKIIRHRETLQRLKAENESIIDEIQRTRTERNKNRDTLAGINVEIDEINRSIEELRVGDSKKNICSICTENEINTVIVNCGHTFCNDCSSRVKDMPECPICRTVKPENGFQMIKIYIS